MPKLFRILLIAVDVYHVFSSSTNAEVGLSAVVSVPITKKKIIMKRIILFIRNI
jgi:hypothetical protein